MKNSRNLKANAALAVICAVAAWSTSQQSALAQSQPANRTYQIFQGITFPNFPGTGSSPTTPVTKPVLPLVEVPTPGLGLKTSGTNSRRSNTGQETTKEKTGVRRRTTTIQRQSTEEKPPIRRTRRVQPKKDRN
jgi:hypothetical protein